MLLQGWNVKAVLQFHCSEEVMLSRMLMRAEMSGRVDDNVEVFRRRYAIHMQDISSITEVFPGKVIEVRITLANLGNNFGMIIAHCYQVDCERPLDDIYWELKDLVEVNCSKVEPDLLLTRYRGDFWRRTCTERKA